MTAVDYTRANPRVPRPWSAPIWALASIWLLGLVASWPALEGPWLLDDSKLQTSIAAFRSQGLEALADGGWKDHLFLSPSGLGRPLSMVSLAANALASPHPWGFKATNLALHLTTASLVYLLVRLLLGRWSGPGGAAALAVALAWTLHPLHVSTWAYAVQRMTVLYSLLSIWAMLLYARLRLAEIDGGSPPSLPAWAPPLLLLPGLALLAKETGVLVPVFLALLELVLFRGRGSRATRRRLGIYFGLAVALGLAAALALMLAPEMRPPGLVGRAFDPLERLTTEARAVTLYLGQILLPRLGHMPFFYDGFAPSRGWLDPPSTLVSALALAALVGLGLALIRRRPLAAFGILFFFAGHLLESTWLPLELVFEHRNYLPSLGLILAAADLIGSARGPLQRWRAPLAAIALIALFALGMWRASLWGSAEQIYATAIASPWPSARARAELAQLLADGGRPEAAWALLADGRGTGPRLQEAYLDCTQTGRIAPGRIRSAQAELPDWIGDYETTALIRIANLALDRRCGVTLTPTLSLLESAAGAPSAMGSSRQKLLMYVGHLRQASGDSGGAVQALEDAFLALPINPVPLLLAANWQLDVGDEAAALALYRRALAVKVPARLDLSDKLRGLQERLAGGTGACPPGFGAPAGDCAEASGR
jgi:hypothetical protein